jgi:hypothetical protein
MQTQTRIEKRAARSIPTRISPYQRLIFFLLSVRLISFHRFITLEQELEGQLRSKRPFQERDCWPVLPPNSQ